METKAFIIEVSIDNYNDVFNGWDPSPIKRRYLNPDLVGSIEDCSDDISLKYNVELHFFLPQQEFNENKEHLTETGIKNSSKFFIHFVKKELV